MPSGRRGTFPRGTALLDAARSLGVYVESVCGGRGICGRCQVVPAFGAFAKHAINSTKDHLSSGNEVEARYSAKRTLPMDRRLSCQARILGDLIVEVPSDTAVNNQVVRKRSEARSIARDPATRLYYVEIEPPDLERPLGDLDRIVTHLASEHRLADVVVDPAVLPLIQPVAQKSGYKVTLAVHDDNGSPTITAIAAGYSDRLFGVACDIGSTTIACHLVDLMSGRTVASAGLSNPQIRFGEDLMSRVSYVMMNADGRVALTTAVRDAVATLIGRVAAQGGISPEDIVEAVVVGNPIMHHLFLGLDPTPLGQSPFALAVSGAVTMPARDNGMHLAPGARLYLLPCIAGHVGADAAAVALSETAEPTEDCVLVVDVGTNAEILLRKGDRLFAASSPTGPAFEGAQISAGQRAAPGAIERVRIDASTLEPRIRVIGADMWSDEQGFAEATSMVGVTGICGSGIIEAIGEMFLSGLVTPDGVIDGTLAARTSRIVPDGRTFAYVLWQHPVEIRITQTDVRAIQLAKGALYAGVRLLMEKLGVAAIDRIKLAGAFGSHIDPLYAMLIGLVPDCATDRISAVGNAAGTGARMALLNRAHRREIEALVRRIEKVETALEPRFQHHFVAAMGFPNSEDTFPNLAAAVRLPERRSTTASGSERRRRRSPAAET